MAVSPRTDQQSDHQSDGCTLLIYSDKKKSCFFLYQFFLPVSRFFFSTPFFLGGERKKLLLIRIFTKFLFFAVIVVLLFAPMASARDFSQIPEKGKVTMVDLGAKKCIPCKMMAPIMEKLEKAYEGNAEIIFIDVWENRKQAPDRKSTRLNSSHYS